MKNKKPISKAELRAHVLGEIDKMPDDHTVYAALMVFSHGIGSSETMDVGITRIGNGVDSLANLRILCQQFANELKVSPFLLYGLLSGEAEEEVPA